MVGIWSLAACLLLLGPTSGGAPRPQGSALATVELRGRVQQAGSREPVGQARVLVIPEARERRPGMVPPHEHFDPSQGEPAWSRATVAEEDGSFALESLPAGLVRVIVLAPGYLRQERVIKLAPATSSTLRLFVEPDGDNPYRTVVQTRTPAPPGQVTTRKLTREEIATLPGTQGDPLRALQNLPGVARAPGGVGLLVLRGAAPNQSRVFFGEHAVPQAFHALAFASIVPADALEDLEFLPSNGPSRYGETTGGVVVMKPRRLDEERFHGHGEVDLAGTSALLRGPLRGGSFLVGATRGWVDAALQGAELVDQTQTFMLPRYYDYQGLFSVRLKPRTELDVRVLGAGDRVLGRSFDPIRGERQVNFGIRTQFHRADLVLRQRFRRWRLLLSPSFRVEGNQSDFQTQPAGRRIDFITSWRAEARRTMSARTELLLGADAEVSRYRVTSFSYIVPSPGEEPVELSRQTVKGVQTNLGVYAQLDARFGALSLWPGLRINAYTLGRGRAASVDPRLSLGWQIAERWALRAGAGIYSQSVVVQRETADYFLDRLTGQLAGGVVLPASFSSLEPRAGFSPVSDDVRVSRAAQASAGLSFDPNELWRLELGAYGRLRSNEDGQIVLGPTTGRDRVEILSSDTYSADYGLEVLLRRQPRRKLYGWLAYTLGRSQRRFLDPVNEPGRPQNNAFDQRHVLAVLASYALPRRWRIGGRFRIVSGSPYTDIVGVVDVPAGSSGLFYGETNAARFPVFHQLDLRIDKQWLRPRTTMTLYFDVQNVYNRINVEAFIYDYYYRERVNAIGLPIFPSLGFRVDF